MIVSIVCVRSRINSTVMFELHERTLTNEVSQAV
eukprot:SAG11_NODE_28225_length_324_cov_0.693333_1_plen_33_part_10